ncbi:MAG: HDOD domain-containing protein [Myxococcota bacterium]
MELEAVVAARVKQGKVSVPPSPVVALRLLQLLDDEKSPLAALVSVLEQDQALAAIVLRLANSARYRRAADVVSLSQAVMMLGRGVLREIAVARELHERSLARGPLVALRRRAWREALSGAQVAAKLAPWFGVKPDEAWVAGLLHDIGRVPAIGILERLLVEHPDADTRSEEGWWALVEEHHLTLGTLLAQKWQLPALVASVIESHHRPHEQGPLVECLRAADQVVRLMDGEAFVPAADLGAIATLSTEQCEELARFLPLLPAALDAFREPQGAETASAVDYELQLVEEHVSGHEVSLTCDGLVSDCALLSATDARLLVRATLPEGHLVRVAAGDARFHARVIGVSGGMSELRPWAMDAEQSRAWGDFLRATGSVT